MIALTGVLWWREHGLFVLFQSVLASHLDSLGLGVRYPKRAGRLDPLGANQKVLGTGKPERVQWSCKSALQTAANGRHRPQFAYRTSPSNSIKPVGERADGGRES